MLVHCFNHCLELAIKDVFSETFFDEIDVMLRRIYYFYKNNPKRPRELKELGRIFEKTVQNPSKSTKTPWIAHKVRAMEIILASHWIFMAHICSLSQTDSQALKRAEIEGLAKKWLQGKYMHLAMFLDILTPIKTLSLTTQKKVHDPVNTIKRINEFSWTKTKLKILILPILQNF